MITSTNNSESDISSLKPLQGMHILLCEDCFDQGRMILKILQRIGAEVTLECNGLAAVHAVNRHPYAFDAIVMDFQMPEMDGLLATQKIREQGYRGAIIAVTSYGTERLKRSWFEAGCSQYLSKPLVVEELIAAVLSHAVATSALAC